MDFEKELKELGEKKLSGEEIYDGVIMHVFRDTVSLPDGNEAYREIIRHVGAVCIIPVTDDGRVIVERQFRYPIDQVITEIPAGKLNSKDEDRLEAAKRELLEETGITADRWDDLGVFYPAAAYSDEKITMYLARGLHFGERCPDEDEFLNIDTIPIDELICDVMDGKITDAKTQLAVLKAAKVIGM